MELKRIETYRLTPGGVELFAAPVSLRMEFVSDGILRMWTTLQDTFRQDETLVVEKREFAHPAVRVQEQKGKLLLETDELSVCVSLDPFYINARDKNGSPVFSTPCSDTIAWENGKLSQRFDLPEDVKIYGLGQGTEGRLNVRGLERRMWQQWDAFRYNGNAGIPFLMTSQGYGVLLNSSWAGRFVLAEGKPSPKSELATPVDMWPEEPAADAQPDRWSILLEGGDMDVFVIHGPDYGKIMQGYAEVAGNPPVMPKWALGYMQSKFGYKNQDEALEVAAEMRRRGIPGDVIIIDIDWFRYFSDLDWVKPYWPDPEAMIRQLRSMGFRVMVVSEPFSDGRSINFKEFKEKGLLYSWPNNVIRTPVDLCNHAVDQTNPEARKLWWEKLKRVFDQGVRGFWCDMGEPQQHPEDSSDQYLGCREKVHNIYSVAWSKGIYDGQRACSEERPFSLFRTTYAGMHRYSAASWSGDVDCTWEVLKDQVVVGQQVCMSGQPYWGTDIGGCMYQDRYDPELFVRWMQWGTFCPIFRNHGVRYNNEPWSYGKPMERAILDCIELRYRLMPYIYTYAYETAKTYVPVIRPMFFAFPEDETAAQHEHQFMFGDSILVAPVIEKGARTRQVYLPKGVWHDYWTGRIYEGGQVVDVFAPLDQVPLFVKGGAIIPMAEGKMSTNESMADRLKLHVYAGADGEFALYEDDGYTYAYENGECALTRYAYCDAEHQLRIAPVEGGYMGMPYARAYDIVLHDADMPAEISVNGNLLGRDAWSYDAGSRCLTVSLKHVPVKDEMCLTVKPESCAYAALPEGGISVRYDLEPLVETEEERLGCVIRVYAEDRNHVLVDHRAALTVPAGWKCISQEVQPLGKHGNASKFLLRMEGTEYAATGAADLTVEHAGGSEKIRVHLLSGWASWWKLAGPYQIGHEGFDTEFMPEKNMCIREDSVEDTAGILDCKRFECFGYVPVQRFFTKQEEGAVGNYTLDCVDRTAYAACAAILPEDRECTIKVMGEDKLKVWINGKLVLAVDQCYGTPAYSRVKMKAGRNEIFIKCSQFNNREAEIWSERSWGFYFAIVDENRRLIDDIVYSVE